MRNVFRGARTDRILEKFGIEPTKFWLLIDLFKELSQRGESTDQLGRSGATLKIAGWLYLAISAGLTLATLISRPQPSTFFLIWTFLTSFLLLNVLVSEAGNSLINPTEAIVLSHQPINGATYTAAKLSHLLRIVIHLVLALNILPAVGGLQLRGAPLYYPLLHLGAMLAIGIECGLLSCAAFGFLIRFIPAKRLRTAAQVLGGIPLLTSSLWGQMAPYFQKVNPVRFIPDDQRIRFGIVFVAILLLLVLTALGLRTLTADYLIRVAGMVRGGSSAGARVQKSWLGGLIARFFGGQPGRAGFSFASRMMLRDWHFRRQLIPLLSPAIIGLVSLARHWRNDPFSQDFAAMHLLPHSMGMFLYLVTQLMPYAADYKGSWIFLISPAAAFQRFAWGIWAMLWIQVVAVPHVVLLPLLAWAWGVTHAAVFLAYSLAVSSIYLAIHVRRIERAPFTQQAGPGRSALDIFVIFAGVVVIAIATGLQYLLFQVPFLVVVLTVILAVGAFFLTRNSVRVFGNSIVFHLGEESGEAGTLYQEVAV
jgi:hypothetical protein